MEHVFAAIYASRGNLEITRHISETIQLEVSIEVSFFVLLYTNLRIKKAITKFPKNVILGFAGFCGYLRVFAVYLRVFCG